MHRLNWGMDLMSKIYRLLQLMIKALKS